MTIIDSSHSVTAALGLGGNVGDPAMAIALALQTLDQRDDCTVLSVSHLYSTPPWGKLDQADFFNCCALVKTNLPPHLLLDALQAIENGQGRERLERWGPRTLDIDILLYGDQVVDAPNLSIPHPRMLERAFVLQPLADIGKELVVSGRSVADWLQQLDTSDITVASSDPFWWKVL